jgi:hypothetical protein
MDAVHVVTGLGFEGGGDGDDAAAKGSGAKQEPGKEVGLELVLAGLAGEDDDEGKAQFFDDGLFNRKRDLALVRAEIDAAGGGPSDGVTPDGGADLLSEGRGKHGIYD